MLVPINRLLGLPILSIQTGAELAKSSTPVIDPRRLQIIAFYVSGHLLEYPTSVLHVEDIREISDVGFIVDNSDRLMDTEGLVRLKEITDFGFNLEGVKVEDNKGSKLGVVKDFAIDPDSFFVQQLYVQPPLFKSLSISVLTIHRNQIVSITNQKIVVKSTVVTEENSLSSKVSTSLTNPFRSPTPTQPETKDL